jgi:hypothetical protein
MASLSGSIDGTHRGENLRFWRSTLRAEDGRVRTRRQGRCEADFVLGRLLILRGSLVSHCQATSSYQALF